MNGSAGASGYWNFTWDINACPIPSPVPASYFDTRTRVGVYVQVTYKPITSFMQPIFGSLRKVTRNIVYRMEPLPTSVNCAYGVPQ